MSEKREYLIRASKTWDPTTFYVWSGSLKGVKVQAADPAGAVDKAVREHLPCVLGPVIRISHKPRGKHPLDIIIEAPYEDLFPDLFADASLDIEVRRVEPK